ncbi:DUF4912 domain-containing protein [Pseudalkalibacillus salsuginis]|uniref:DUF4912 domain-containing protein n=1 Tax=Pseudalkalibacillus salsuginis TaxID=2910972 RepID=UPI001F192EC7|nr:DUF4912 domain-containing protein [Pseudalkalibacillus salsuginis]MCF6408479.1 DUF4912 domain-containing protein [Pseudalkalibacillus salsuginis]
MVEKILALKNKGYTIKQIAEEMDSTVGKIQYRLRKLQKLDRTSSFKKNQLPETRVHISRKIPSTYEMDRLALLPQGPHTVYAYWDLKTITSNMVAHHFRKPWSDLNKQLRVYDISDLHFNGHNSHWYFDISLPEMTDNWFINNLEDNRTFIVDFGIQCECSGFFTVLRSAPIETPRTAGGSMRHNEAVDRWKSGAQKSPEWYEQFSTYSIYSLLK